MSDQNYRVLRFDELTVQRNRGEDIARKIQANGVMDYIYDMPRYYQEADMHFCRGGAGSLSETAAFGVVPVVVPLPAADNHQQHNAEALVRADAGFMLVQKTFDPAQFKKIVSDLMSNPDLKNKMSKNLKQLAPLKASQKIASDILESIQQ